MSPPSDKNDTNASSVSRDGAENPNHEYLKSNGMDQTPVATAESSATSHHGTVTNIPLITAKMSTFKCSENDQMKTFDPGEVSSNGNMINQCGYQLKFPLKNSNNMTKTNKNYKAGSKINKLADMLAKRSQNIVEMKQNMISDVIADIISAPKKSVERKVENKNCTMDVSVLPKVDHVELSNVFCEKTVSNQTVDSAIESVRKSVPNNEDCENNSKQLKPKMSQKYCSNISEVISQDTPFSEINALKEHLVKSETDGSTKLKKEIRKNLKNVELSLILPEKKKRSSPRKKIVNSDKSDLVEDKCQDNKIGNKVFRIGGSNKSCPTNEQLKPESSVNKTQKADRMKSIKQRKLIKLVETSTQTSTIDFVCVEASKAQAVPEAPPELQIPSKNEISTISTDSTLVKSEKLSSVENTDSVDRSESNELQTAESTDSFEKQSSSLEVDLNARVDHEKKVDDDTRIDNLDNLRNPEKFTYACMYCTAAFTSKSDCKDHEKSHSPKKSKQITKCQFCNKQYPSLYDLKLHCIKNHPNKYAYCVKCDERFCEKTQLYSHNKSLHLTKAMEAAQNLVKIQETLGMNAREKSKEEIEEIKKSLDKKSGKSTGGKGDLKVDVTFDSSKKSSASPRAIPRTVSPRENKTEEQLLEMEMLFYSNLSGNIKENLANHLDGKIDKNGHPVQTDAVKDSFENGQTKTKSATLLSVVTGNCSGAPSDLILRAPSPYQTRSKTPNPLPPTAKKFKKLPNWQQKFWEKYNFPTNYRYEHRFWDKNYLDTEKSAFYLKDLSCLDIKTQLTMRENIKKLDQKKKDEDTCKTPPLFKPTFPDYLSLIPKVSDGHNQKYSIDNKSPDCLRSKNQSKDDKKSTKLLTTGDSKMRRKSSADSSGSGKKQQELLKTFEQVKMMTRRQSVIELSKNLKKDEDAVKRRKGSLDVTGCQKMILRRQTSVDNIPKGNGPESISNTNKSGQDTAPESKANENESEDNISTSLSGLAEISGEWVRPRSYLCGTCCAKFTNLWELEDHKWVNHPNVWCTHYEFEDEKIDKLFHRSDSEVAEDDEDGGGDCKEKSASSLSKLKLTDLYKRYLLPHGSLKTAKLVPNMSFPEQCTKCKKNCMTLPEMHKHMLDCGGDTTWFLTMYSSPMTIKRKWRPFGSRRRKQIGRRMVKRNIPNTSNIRPYHYQHRIRTKPGDVESIQKMLANLPEKRTRRAINFDDIKTRSQATIHSNRLLRKRFKVSFGTNMMRLKALKQQQQQQRQVKSVKKESSSKSTTDVSSENTPTSSPKRKCKPKGAVQLPKEEILIVETVQQASVAQIKDSKKKAKQTKKKESSKQNAVKKGSKNYRIGGKPLTRSSTSAGGAEAEKETLSRHNNKKGQLVDDEVVSKTDILPSTTKDKKKDKNKQPSTKKSHKIDNSVKVESKESVPKELSVGAPFRASEGDTSVKRKSKTDVKEEVIQSNAGFVDYGPGGQVSENVYSKKKRGKLPPKKILRLKSNVKEKTELIKRIRKSLRNSKRILEKRESKVKHERRRSLRLQTLQLTEPNSKTNEITVTLDKAAKDVKDRGTSVEHKRPKSPQPIFEKETTVKKTSKIFKNVKAKDPKNTSGDSVNEENVRRSSRIVPGLNIKEENTSSAAAAKDNDSVEIQLLESVKKNYENVCSFEGNRSELADTIRRSPSSTESSDCRKTFDHSGGPLIGHEFESIRKPGRPSCSKTVKAELVQDSQSSKSLPSTKTGKTAPLEVEKVIDKSSDLSEMPVLDKEEPVRGRPTRKSETDIPVLMPFENEERATAVKQEGKTAKRKGVLPRLKVVGKRRRSSERVNPLRTVKDDEEVAAHDDEVLEPSTRSKNKSVRLSHDGRTEKRVKKRKRFVTVNEPTVCELNLPQIPKVKKYFLGICPNEIDKGGDIKNESESDSEPLITLLTNQKNKEVTETCILLTNETQEFISESCVTENNASFPESQNANEVVSVKEVNDKAIQLKSTEGTPVEHKMSSSEKTLVKPEKEKEAVNVESSKDELPGNLHKEEAEKNTFDISVAVDSLESNVNETQRVPGPNEDPDKENENEPDDETSIPVKKSLKGLKMTVKLKVPSTLKISEEPFSRETQDPAKVPDKNDKEKPTECQVSENFSLSESTLTSEESEAKVERRSRRVSKEIKATNEFIIDDPLILIDELWSDLDSDSDSSKKRTKKSKKKTPKKRATHDDNKDRSVNLEELLRNFGESKNAPLKDDSKLEAVPATSAKEIKKRKKIIVTSKEKRMKLERRVNLVQKSGKRLSLRLFRFHKKIQNFGGLGRKLLHPKPEEHCVKETNPEFKTELPALPFLAAEIKENPVQIIQCGVQKVKPKKSPRNPAPKSGLNMQLKISLPLQSINNLAVLNNNHLTEVLDVDHPDTSKMNKIQDVKESLPQQKEPEGKITLKESCPSVKPEEISQPVAPIVPQKEEDPADPGTETVESSKIKPRRSEVIDKIFYCEICKTYYYSSSQLKIHKLSNRHKLKESELSQATEVTQTVLVEEKVTPMEEQVAGENIAAEETLPEQTSPLEETAPEERPPLERSTEKSNTEEPKGIREAEEALESKSTTSKEPENIDPEKMNDDTWEMPILEGPFIENPFVRLGVVSSEPPPPKPVPPPSRMFGFTEDCLKDIQRAIGCTDEEMLILTLLGENTIEIEDDVLDLDSYQPVSSSPTTPKTNKVEETKDKDSINGLFKMDFKKRITSALARLVNRAVLNLLQKYRNTSRTGISPEALSFLVKLSKVNNEKNVLELDELLKKGSGGESSNKNYTNDSDKKDNTAYKYSCSGARFQKDFTREWPDARSDGSKGVKCVGENVSQPLQANKNKDENVAKNKYKGLFHKESMNDCQTVRPSQDVVLKNVEELSSSPVFVREDDKKEQNVPYKYLCTICGSRFQKESMWECHIKRSHKSKGKKNGDEMQIAQTTYDEDWSSTWTYDINDEQTVSNETPQFLCSDCGINFLSPQEVLEHQKLEHAGQKDSDPNDSGPLQSSTIGSSDEIIKGKKTTVRGPKHMSKEDFDQQRIIANNELRKLDRKFTGKNKAGKIKWGMDALKFTVEKENKAMTTEKDVVVVADETPKSQVDPKSIDIIPKLNLSRTSNIPEFKVVQKASCLNRFQRILDNKLKRRSTRIESKDDDEKEKILSEPEVAAAAVAADVKKDRKRKVNKLHTKKDEVRKVLDVYDFNDSESEPEPVAFSHVKKGGVTQTKLKLVKVKDISETSKNKADSTTKDLETEDYDSEDSLPLAVVKRTRAEEDDDEARTEDAVEKSEGILEQVEYLIEQLENDTNQNKSEKDDKEKSAEKEVSKTVKDDVKLDCQKKGRHKRKVDLEYPVNKRDNTPDSQPETFRVSLENKFLQLNNLTVKRKDEGVQQCVDEGRKYLSTQVETADDSTPVKSVDILQMADSSQSVSDDEDSLPLVLMSKKNESSPNETKMSLSERKDEASKELLTFSKQDNPFSFEREEETDEQREKMESVESSQILSGNDDEEPSERCEKLYETLNGNVIYRRNDSISEFDSDGSGYGQLDSISDKAESESFIKEVMEKEDVVIVCSKKDYDVSKTSKKKPRESPKRKKSDDSVQRKKKILPLLSVTLEEEIFRKSKSPKLKKEDIVKKIWSKRKLPEDLIDENDENSTTARSDCFTGDTINNDDSQSEIDKEIIMKKIWNKKRLEHDCETTDTTANKSESDKQEDVKINQTEVSNEVVIRCGPKAKAVPKRKKMRMSSKETSKDKIMRKIWSGKCTFQTKAALKTYESDVLQNSKGSNLFEDREKPQQRVVKKRGRPPNFLNPKKAKAQSDAEKSNEDDDLDSLLEEIEREEVEKAIRLEFLQLRRSDRANVEVSKEGGTMTVGLFAETSHKEGKDVSERKRKRIKKNVTHPRRNLLNRRKFIKKSVVKQLQQDHTESQDGTDDGTAARLANPTTKPDYEPVAGSLGTAGKSFGLESKIKNRKHKKHRHKHHHHKHKHKKSKHHKYFIGSKHKVKHRSVDSGISKLDEGAGNFSVLEKMCNEIPGSVDASGQPRERLTSELDNLDTKLDEILMSTSSSSFDAKVRDCQNMLYNAASRSVSSSSNSSSAGRTPYRQIQSQIYEFVEDDSSSNFLSDCAKGRHKN